DLIRQGRLRARCSRQDTRGRSGMKVRKTGGVLRSPACLAVLFISAVVTKLMVFVDVFASRMMPCHKRAVMPTPFDQPAQPSKIPVPRPRIATAGVAAQVALDYIDAMRERNPSCHPPSCGVTKRKRSGEAASDIQVSDPAAVR